MAEDMKLFREGGPEAVKASKAVREGDGKEGGGDGFEEVKGKKKKGRGEKEEGGSGEATATPKGLEKAPFGGRKVFIGGTADKDHDELKEHFAQYGEVCRSVILCLLGRCRCAREVSVQCCVFQGLCRVCFAWRDAGVVEWGHKEPVMTSRCLASGP